SALGRVRRVLTRGTPGGNTAEHGGASGETETLQKRSSIDTVARAAFVHEAMIRPGHLEGCARDEQSNQARDGGVPAAARRALLAGAGSAAPSRRQRRRLSCAG